MAVKDDLGTRMKEFYETVPKTRLMRRTPVAIRIDGKAFHTFTRGLKKPFDDILMRSMQDTMQYLCENIQGCVLGYTQSDEITLILIDYQTLDTAAWFDYEVQKLCSISASMATLAFNKAFSERVDAWIEDFFERWNISEEDKKYARTIQDRMHTGAMFDARCFNIPQEEVTNLLYWRQLNASRNSVQMVGQAHFTHKQLQGMSCSAIQDMLMLEKGINWNDLPTAMKRGTCCIRQEVQDDNGQPRGKWIIDTDIPIFKGEGRKYVEKLIRFD